MHCEAPIRSGKQAKALNGIGDSIASKIQEFIDSGACGCWCVCALSVLWASKGLGKMTTAVIARQDGCPVSSSTPTCETLPFTNMHTLRDDHGAGGVPCAGERGHVSARAQQASRKEGGVAPVARSCCVRCGGERVRVAGMTCTWRASSLPRPALLSLFCLSLVGFRWCGRSESVSHS